MSAAPSIDWRRVERELDELGYARLPGLLAPAACRDLAALYPEAGGRFRSTVSMQQHRYGEGEYRYFAYPLPGEVARLRTRLYPPLARIANTWQRRFGAPDRYPRSLRAFLRHCHERGQTRPTPLLLRYEEGGFNCLHQDLYGAVAFPLQVVCLLSRPERDFTGGDFLLLEQRPRRQSRGEAIRLEQGEGLVFPNRERPVEGARGTQRAALRHGISRVHSGERLALGVIFHDAR